MEMDEEKVDKEKVERSIALRRARRLVLPKALKPKHDGTQWRPRHGKDAGTAELEPYHRAKLRALLAALFQEHCYPAAAGVVSVLLQASTIRDQLEHRDLSYFWAAMEVLRQADTGKSNILKIKRLYRILQRQQINPRLRGEVQLELALYLMSLGDYDSYEASYNEIRPIIDVPPFRDDPVVSLCHGYTLHRLWHDRAVQDVEKHFVQDLGARPQHGVDREDYEEGGGENDVMDVEEEHRDEDDSVGTSVGRQSSDQDFGLGEDTEVLEIGDRNVSSQGNQRGLYEEDEQEHELDDFWRTAVVRWSPDLDRRLFPVRLPQTRTKSVYKVPMDSGRTRDAHVNAIKYLRQALSQASNLTPALLPLVQLLLAAGDVSGAMEEIDKCCDTPHLIPLSIKALLLESIGSKDTRLLSQCYASILHINPSSVHSLDALIRLHTSGKYRSEALVECIATHLDVEAGALETWQQLAACLLLLVQRWNKDTREREFTRTAQSLGIMEEGDEKDEKDEKDKEARDVLFPVWRKNTWDDRSDWWRHKHFHEESITVEQPRDGDWRRVTYKAACATYIIGPGSAYETAVCRALAAAEADSLLALLKMHRESV